MIEVVYGRVRQASRLAAVLVATDDDRIAQAVRGFGGMVVMTSPDHTSGTDRVAEAAATLEASASVEADVIVNVQGDEPLIRPDQIDALVQAVESSPRCDMATLMTPCREAAEMERPDVVKVVADLEGYAMYFSRATIPNGAGGRGEGRILSPACKHIGVYAYRREFLFWMARTPPTPLEKLERLEQLRALEHGRKIKVVMTEHDTVAVDRPDDIQKVVRLMGA